MTEEALKSMLNIMLTSMETKLKLDNTDVTKSYLEGYRDCCKLLLEYVEKK
jgi:hypothetical protein